MSKELEQKIAAYIDPYTGMNFVDAKAITNISEGKDGIKVEIALGYPTKRLADFHRAALIEHLNTQDIENKIEITVTSKIESHSSNLNAKDVPGIKNMIAIASGKGGVGKSTLAVNFALALVEEGANVGLLDADVYGPSQPILLGTEREKPVVKDKILTPIDQFGLKTMSIGYLIESQVPMIWRGPMIGKALEQLVYETNWGALDYLIIDLPPGTGDIHLTLCQKLPLTAALIITTPQDVALADVKRACNAFKKLNVPIVGIVENMSHYLCQNCGHEAHLFGMNGGKGLAKEFDVKLLGQIPISLQIREAADSHVPSIISDPDGEISNTIFEIARHAAGTISTYKKNYAAKFGKIAVKGK